MGHALVRYNGFANRGFRIAMVFDVDPSKIGTRVGEYTIEDVAKLTERVKAAKLRIAMLAVPASAAQDVADRLVQAGVRAILNYAPTSLNVPKGVHGQHIDPATHLQRMTYYLE